MTKPTYGVGTLAFYQGVDGAMVPCKVEKITRGAFGSLSIQARITANRGAWKRGMMVDSTPTWIFPRDRVRLRTAHRLGWVLGGYSWTPSEDAPAVIGLGHAGSSSAGT
jgi:hypothetical protein